uniref:Protein LSD1 isoform X2 n=1 Tax=Elaeis guineensis var. tenera TaxID=51953 RepID=A0A6I9R5A6_ELAGV|nr:protein LSD1 isoform X2 [Elaeis guineensis]
MPVPLIPYAAPPVPFTPPNGSQSQIVCSGCRNLLLYPLGATSVCCAVCNAVTVVPSPGTEMARLVCGGCHMLLMHMHGAYSVQCSCCHTINLALEGVMKSHYPSNSQYFSTPLGSHTSSIVQQLLLMKRDQNYQLRAHG